MLHLGGFEGVLQEAGDGHRTDAAGDGGDGTGDFDGFVIGDIADEFAFAVGAGDAVDTDVDNNGAGLNPAAFDELWAANGCDQDIGAAADGFEVTGAGVGDGDGAVFLDKELRHRFANDVGTADDDSIKAFEAWHDRLGEDDGTGGGAGDEAAFADRQASDVHGMEAVDILVGVDGLDDLEAVDVLGERHLDQDAVNGRIAIKFADEGEERCFAGFRRELVFDRLHADFDGLEGLVLDVDFAGWVFADENDGKPRNKAVIALQLGNLRADVGADLRCDRLAIDYAGL